MSGKRVLYVVVAALVMLGYYSASILFTDGMSFSKDSYNYWLVITAESIQSFPLIEPAGQPTFFYSSADGTSPSIQEVVYLSTASETEIRIAITEFASSRGYREQGQFFLKEDEQFGVALNPAANSKIEVRASVVIHQRQ